MLILSVARGLVVQFLRSIAPHFKNMELKKREQINSANVCVQQGTPGPHFSLNINMIFSAGGVQRYHQTRE